MNSVDYKREQNEEFFNSNKNIFHVVDENTIKFYKIEMIYSERKVLDLAKGQKTGVKLYCICLLKTRPFSFENEFQYDPEFLKKKNISRLSPGLWTRLHLC